MNYKLALIGKSIAHSLSPKMYEELLDEKFDYTLLDFDTPGDIPSLAELKQTYAGINITAPYKRLFFNDVKLVGDIKDLEGINCLNLLKNPIEGTNTDYLATKEILNTHFKTYEKYLILGDGVMGKMVVKVLNELGRPYVTISRRIHGPLENYEIAQHLDSLKQSHLIINSCSRDFRFKGKLLEHSDFWDLNYKNQNNQEYSKRMAQNFSDGESLLRLQAIFAIKFWGLKLK